MTNYTKEVSEQIGAREADTDITVRKTSIWEKVITPIHLPSNKHLVGHWSFNEGSGMIAHDESIYGNHGTLVNMEEGDWVDGVVGKALDFDGENDYAGVLASESLVLTDKITIAAWVYSRGPTEEARQQMVVARSYEWRFGSNAPSSNAFGFYAPPPYTGSWMSTTISRNTWHFIVFTYDKSFGSNNAKLYVDGDLKNQMDADGDLTSVGSIHIGTHGSGTYHFNGLIDEVRIYKRALMATEGKALYLYPDLYPAGPTIWTDNKIIQEQEDE